MLRKMFPSKQLVSLTCCGISTLLLNPALAILLMTSLHQIQVFKGCFLKAGYPSDTKSPCCFFFMFITLKKTRSSYWGYTVSKQLMPSTIPTPSNCKDTNVCQIILSMGSILKIVWLTSIAGILEDCSQRIFPKFH